MTGKIIENDYERVEMTDKANLHLQSKFVKRTNSKKYLVICLVLLGIKIL